MAAMAKLVLQQLTGDLRGLVYNIFTCVEENKEILGNKLVLVVA